MVLTSTFKQLQNPHQHATFSIITCKTKPNQKPNNQAPEVLSSQWGCMFGLICVDFNWLAGLQYNFEVTITFPLFL